MAKTILGVDIGHDTLKLALVKGNVVKKVAMKEMPQNLIRDARVISTETMGELIRMTMKENGIRCKNAAISLHHDNVYIRSVTMPLMTIDQLTYNLPFEFRDYISDELQNYVFDYSIINDKDAVTDNNEVTEEDGDNILKLMAVAAPKSIMEETREIMARGSLKLVSAAPSICAFQNLIREFQKRGADPGQEYCIIDMGYNSIRMHMFKGDRHVITRALEVGMRNLDTVIADAYSVDSHLAHTYLMTNYEDCQNKEYCINAYGNIAVEMIRALNFYRFSNQNSKLNDVWLCGGGANIVPLNKALAENLDMKIHSGKELIPARAGDNIDYSLLQAIGIAMS